MAAATINGKPNLFISPEPPTEKYPTYSERVSDFVSCATDMATESVSEADMLNDPEFQESYKEYCENLDAEWRNDPEAQRKFAEWCDEQERKERQVSELETAEAEAYEAHLEAQAEAHDLAQLGDGYIEAINGHDLKWQEGVA